MTQPKLHIEDNSSPAGFLTVRKRFADGSTETIIEKDPNVITDASKRHHLSFIYDKNVVQDVIDSFKVGTGGTIDPEGNRPIKPDPSRNDLYQPLVINHDDILITPSPENDSRVFVTINFALRQDEAVDELVTEVALFTEGNKMFNHKTFRAVPKTESFSLEFEWRIVYV